MAEADERDAKEMREGRVQDFDTLDPLKSLSGALGRRLTQSRQQQSIRVYGAFHDELAKALYR